MTRHYIIRTHEMAGDIGVESHWPANKTSTKKRGQLQNFSFFIPKIALELLEKNTHIESSDIDDFTLPSARSTSGRPGQWG